MKNSTGSVSVNISFWSALLTIVITRISLWITWSSPIMSSSKSDLWHHAYTGLLIWIVGSLFGKGGYKQAIKGIGLGLMIDEATVPFKLLGIWAPDYWSVWSWGTASVILIFWLISELRTPKYHL